MNGYTTRSKTDKPKPKNVANTVLFEHPVDGGNGESSKTMITFTKHDAQQIETPRFLNDTVISFFMQYYLENYVSKDLRGKVHIFNSFFFNKIKSIRVKVGEEKTIPACTSRWLKGTTLFDKDFLILPVCEKDHWILIIICYPYNKPTRRSYKIPDEKLYEPAVIVMNSFHNCAPSVKKILGQFLKFSWLNEKGTTRQFTINNAKPNGIRLLFPKLPQQRNAYNCGVFILNYFLCFLKDPRGSYLKMFRNRPMTDWFSENKIDIGAERRKMKAIIREQTLKWEMSDLKAQLDKERTACRSVTPDASKAKETTTIDIMDEDESGNHIIVIN